MSTSKKKIQIDPHIKALLGMMAFVLILMAILKGDTYFTIPNLRSMFSSSLNMEFLPLV